MSQLIFKNYDRNYQPRIQDAQVIFKIVNFRALRLLILRSWSNIND